MHQMAVTVMYCRSEVRKTVQLSEL